MAYNGFANFATWNVALWIGNDEGLYRWAREARSYEAFRRGLREDLGIVETPDGVSYNDSGLDLAELAELFAELNEGGRG